MTVISNWRAVVTRSASVWCILAGLLALLGFFFASVTPAFAGWPPFYFAAASALFQTLAIPARIILQRGLHGLDAFRCDDAGALTRRSVGLLAGGGIALSTAIAFIGGWEGLRQEAYRDVVGVWTVCYGKTTRVRPGDQYSKAECDRMLASEIAQYERGLDQCLKVDVPAGMKIALVSWTYNVGVRAACQSTLLRRANAGDLAGACDELTRWNRANGRVWRGLTRRRISEREMCHAALKQAA